MNESTAPPENPPPPLSLFLRFRQYLRQLAGRLVVYLVMYLLISIATIGPFFWYWFESTYANGPQWIQRFYAPLLWLSDHFWPLSWIVNQYINWWIR